MLGEWKLSWYPGLLRWQYADSTIPLCSSGYAEHLREVRSKSQPKIQHRCKSCQVQNEVHCIPEEIQASCPYDPLWQSSPLGGANIWDYTCQNCSTEKIRLCWWWRWWMLSIFLSICMSYIALMLLCAASPWSPGSHGDADPLSGVWRRCSPNTTGYSTRLDPSP